MKILRRAPIQPKNLNLYTKNQRSMEDEGPRVMMPIAPPNNTISKVIVIGAGISGLAAARELQIRGYDVLVLEARRRPGGRLKAGYSIGCSDTGKKDSSGSGNNTGTSSSTSSGSIDLGGALLHGITDNPVYDLLVNAQIPTVPMHHECLVLDDAGWPIDPKKDEKALQQFNACLDATFQKLHHRQKERTEGTTLESSSCSSSSFGQVFDEIMAERPTLRTDPIFRWHQANLEISCGCSLSKLGKDWNEDEAYGFEGAHVALPDTWERVIRQMAEPLDIIYDQQVTKIEIVEPMSSCAPRQQEQQPKRQPTTPRRQQPSRTSSRPVGAPSTTTPSDKDRRASQRLRGESPPLLDSTPRRIRKTVEAFTVEHSRQPRPFRSSEERKQHKPHNNKTLVRIELSSGQVITADACICTLPLGVLKANVVDIPQLTANHQTAIQQLGCGLLNKVAIQFAKKTWDDSHFIGLAHRNESVLILNATAVNDTTTTGNGTTSANHHQQHYHPTLVFLYGGDSAITMQSQNDEQIVQHCLSHVYKVCGTVPDLVDYHITRWGLEPFSRMSFSYITPQASSDCYSAVSQPICDSMQVPRILFAGEHTTKYYPSTIHGAFLSGVREAYRLDCSVDDELNQQVRFRDTDVYRPTFVLGDHGATSTPPPPTSALTTPYRNGRRSAFAHQAAGPEEEEGHGRVEAHSRAKKSSRLQRIPNIQDAESLQQRTLERCLESYGPDYKLIATMLPTYGGIKLSPTQIRRLVPPGRKRRLPAAFASTTTTTFPSRKRRRPQSNVTLIQSNNKNKSTNKAGTSKPGSSALSLAKITTRFGRVSKPIIVLGVSPSTTSPNKPLKRTRFGRVSLQPILLYKSIK